jgi:hypothetical protein
MLRLNLFVALRCVVLVDANRINPEPLRKTFAHGLKGIVQVRSGIEAASIETGSSPRVRFAPYIRQSSIWWLRSAIEDLDLQTDIASLRAWGITQQSYVLRSYGRVLVSSRNILG